MGNATVHRYEPFDETPAIQNVPMLTVARPPIRKGAVPKRRLSRGTRKAIAKLPNVMGKKASPAPKGFSPRETSRYWAMKNQKPAIEPTNKKRAVLAPERSALANKCSGTNGALARCSVRRKRPNSATPTISGAMVSARPHPYSEAFTSP